MAAKSLSGINHTRNQGAHYGMLLPFLRSLVGTTTQTCIIWPFSAAPDGYGRIRFGNRRMTAHRAMCILAHGEPPTSKYESAHSCGHGHLGCVNPNHLSWKTRKENDMDKDMHGTRLCGDRHPSSALTETDVEEIRELAKTRRMTQRAIAKRFGITQGHVSNIKRRLRRAPYQIAEVS